VKRPHRSRTQACFAERTEAQQRDCALALHVAQEAMQQAEVDANEVASVFASSDGETGVLDRLCTALATPQRTISPTLFHHSS